MTAVTFDAVAERISVMLSVPTDGLTPQTPFSSLGADSFRLVELVVDLQEEFDSMFTQAELKQISTIGELVGLLGGERRAESAGPVSNASAN
ncbi:MAG TPA: acyl carrier protein [Actinocrinis sp.]|jgi:acyl carrier protein